MTHIMKGTTEIHKLLPQYKDHPALVDDAAKADALLLTLMLTATGASKASCCQSDSCWSWGSCG